MAKCWKAGISQSCGKRGSTWVGGLQKRGHPTIGISVQSLQRAVSCMDLKVQMLKVGWFLSEVISEKWARRRRRWLFLFSSSIKYMYVQENTSESIRLENWRRTGRRNHWRGAGMLERTLQNKQEEKKKAHRRENDGLEQAVVGFWSRVFPFLFPSLQWKSFALQAVCCGF